MQCLNDFKNDRVCDICKIVNTKEYTQCKKDKENKIKIEKALNYIRNACKHQHDAYDEYYKYTQCDLKNGEDDCCRCNLNCISNLNEEQQKIVNNILN